MRKKIAILGLILILGMGKLVMAQVWQKIVTSGTPPDKRNGHVLISPGGSEQFIFGGFGQNNDLWVLKERGETSEWERRDTIGTAPSVRGGHSGIFVPEDGAVVEDSIIIFGGSQNFEGVLVDSETYKLEDPWQWQPQWEKLTIQGTAPSSRAEHTAVYEQGSNKMVVFGGYTDGGLASSETYTLDFNVFPASWTEVNILGDKPSARYGHSAVLGDWQQMIVFGGKDNSGDMLDDCWWVDLWSKDWNEIYVPGGKPPARWQHTAVWIRGDPMTMEPGGMLIFGGEDEDENLLDDVWVLQQPFGEPNWKWEELYPIGDLPSVRSGHAVASGWGWGWGWGWEGGEKMFIFGGSGKNGDLNDVYAFARGEKVKETLQEKPFNVPNPFNPDTEETKICYYLDEDDDVKIKLFTLTGDLVYSWENIPGRKGLNQESWDGRNEKGRIVENGGYICLIEAGGEKQKCKIAVLR